MFVSIPSHPRYEINNVGEVRRKLKSGGYRIINPWKGDSHYAVTLTDEFQQRSVHYLHRLVLIAFGPPQPEDMPLVLHLDDDSSNNHLDNLVWGDKRMNALMAVKNGRLRPGNLRVYLTREEAARVREQYASGRSMRQIAAEFGCSRWTVSNIVHNRVERLS